MSIKVRPIGFGKRDVTSFIDVLWRVFADDPAWAPPLRRVLREDLDPAKTPFLRYGEAQLFLVERDGVVVGRISAHVNPRHDAYQDERAGFFGFFDCDDDAEAARVLFGAAEAWLAERRVAFIRGPLSFTINDEVGCLVDGFDTPPSSLMAHSRPYYGALIEDSGYAKAKDLLAWYYPVEELAPRLKLWRDRIRAMPNVHVRSFDKRQLRRDVGIALDIFNEAWKDNWGFVPVSDEEADRFADGLKQIADPRITAIVEIDGKPAAMIVAIPNLSELTRGLNGRLFPFGWAKFLWRRHRRVKSGRVILLGLLPEHRTRALAGMNVMLVAEIHVRGAERGYEWAELSWILEDNPLMSTLERVPGRVYKRYRIYEKTAGGR